ncbi:MAG: type II toxin-antitoxin system VapC family toxin [Candidatus Brocadiaceae bacterium]|nr:type II toxin-antitoxin system VapC family toxin [Candidatus Brocadiaceae bacterium]
MNGRISLDTNIVIRLFKNDLLVTKALDTITTICLPTPVIAELLFAARNSTYQKENLKVYNEFINACTVLNITRETANLYSIIRLELKHKGRPIPENDLWIASICKEQNLPLFTGDAHFDTINGLKVVNL